MSKRLVTGLVTAILGLAAACSEGGDAPELGAKDPQTAVRNLLAGIVAGDQEAIEDAINPIYSTKTAEVGVGDLVRLAELGEIEIRSLKLSAEFDADRQNARVFVNGTIVTAQGEAALGDKVLLTSKQGDRWYVTSPNSEYWASQLRPPPSDWQQMQADANPNLPGVYIPPHPGADGVLLGGSTDDRAHFANELTLPLCTAEQIASNSISNPLCYPSNPPTSGPHAASAAPFRVFTTPAGKEFLVHSREQGGVVIWYNSNDPSVLQKLLAVTELNLARGKLVSLTFYPGLEPDTIAITAWTRLDKFAAAELDISRLQRFIDAHERRFNPEGF